MRHRTNYDGDPRTVAEICRLNGFEDGDCTPSWIFKKSKF